MPRTMPPEGSLVSMQSTYSFALVRLLIMHDSRLDLLREICDRVLVQSYVQRSLNLPYISACDYIGVRRFSLLLLAAATQIV